MVIISQGPYRGLARRIKLVLDPLIKIFVDNSDLGLSAKIFIKFLDGLEICLKLRLSSFSHREPQPSIKNKIQW